MVLSHLCPDLSNILNTLQDPPRRRSHRTFRDAMAAAKAARAAAKAARAAAKAARAAAVAAAAAAARRHVGRVVF